MSHDKHLAVATAVTIAVLAGAIACIDFDKTPPPPASGTMTATATPRPPRATGERTANADRQLVEDDSGWYRAPIGRAFRFACKANLDAATVADDGTRMQSQHVDFRGPLQVVVVDRDADQLTLSVCLPTTDVVFRAGGRLLEEHGEVLAKSLASHWFVRMTTDGATTALQLPPDVPPEHASWLRSLVVATRCRFATDDAAEWQHEEADSEGLATFAYRMLANDPVSERLCIERARLQRVGARTALPMRGRAGGEVTFDRHLGWLCATTWQEHTEVTLTELNAHAEVRWSCSTGLEEVTDLPRSVLVLPADDRWVSVATPGADRAALAERRETAHWRALLDGVALEQLLADLLAAALAGDVDDARLRELVEKLGWHLRLDPEGVQQVLAAAMQNVAADLARESLFAALGASQQPKAQDALVSVLADEQMTMEVREGATRSLFQVESPPRRLVQQVIEQAGFGDSASRSAMLLIGAFGDGRDRQAARVATDWLLEQERRAIRENRLPEWIASIGNQKTARATATLLRYVDHADVAVRARVAVALGDRPGAEIDKVLRERATSEADAEVRSHIARGAIRRDLLDVTVVREFCTRLSPAVRLASLEALAGRGVAPRVLVHEAIQQLAASEPDVDLKRAAQRVLKRYPQPR